ncbi:carbon-nitrogen hydrolase family protein [Homoserinimonas hongtaonis]|uniref:Hydrolase n=1 Tax=Homoserinimonas hongtaonis TaxID=2079791 RepID=A0A2U1SWW7_9MICO|nr:carbon-nitrogen hydrolase family protein [Salinibacterium hongtaonis]PWB96125.1 hydrolase [Salinibacterium hongtaonis]
MSRGHAGSTHPQHQQVAIAVAQFAPGNDGERNLATVRDLATAAAERGAKLVVFPEYSSYFTPTLGANTVEAAEPLDGPFVIGVAAIAKILGIHVVAGMIEQTIGGDRVYNTVVAVDPQGRHVATYRKIHLYDAFGQQESEWVAPGPVERPEVFTVDGLTVGLQTCYDLRFPEVSRRLMDAGVDVIACPSEWVRGPLKEHHWRTLITARALENTLYVAAADHTPPIGVGNSMIVDPMGVEIATAGERVDIALGWVTKSRIDDVRITNPAVKLRRFGVHPL